LAKVLLGLDSLFFVFFLGLASAELLVARVIAQTI